MASPEADARAKEFARPASGGIVYVVRTNEHFWSAGGAVAVLVDDKHVGNVLQYTYLAVPLESGIHRVTTLVLTVEETVTIDVHDGAVYFVESDVVPGMMNPKPIARRMTDSEGRDAVIASKLTAK